MPVIEKRASFEEMSQTKWGLSTVGINKFCRILDEVIDDASYGWTPHLEDRVHWCVWSAPIDLQVALRLNVLAGWLLRWDMNKVAELAWKKTLFCLMKIRGLEKKESIRMIVSLSRAVWNQNRLEEALELLKSAGEAFSAVEDEGCQCDAMRCFVKVAAAYDTLGWYAHAQEAWNRVSNLL